MSKKDINFLSISEPGTVIEDRQIIVPLPAPNLTQVIIQS